MGLPYPRCLLQGRFIKDLYLATIDGDEALLRKYTQSADGVARRHVAQVGHVLAAWADAQRASVFIRSIAFFEEQDAFCQAATDMLLRKVDRTGIASAKCYSQSAHKEPAELGIVHDELTDEVDGNAGNDRGFEGCGCRGPPTPSLYIFTLPLMRQSR